MNPASNRKMISSVLAAMLAAGLAGCTAANATSASTAAPTASAAASALSSTAASAGSMIDTASLFTDRDMEQTPDLTNAVKYTVSDNTDITITDAGVYVISGTAENCTITVKADAEAKVQIVLSDVSISNSDTPAIYVVSADKVFVTLSGSSSLAVTGTFTADGTTNTDAVIFAKSDLTMNGTGSLTIASTANGITSKDTLKVTGGTYDITCSKHGLEGKDAIAIADGTFTINSIKDGIHSENSDDLSLGSVYIAGGTFQINAKDDGIHGTTVVQIDGGTFNIQAVEGIEGTYVQINGGTISITASDDGINAAAKSTFYDVVIELNSGDITIVMGSGDTDAVDANGSIYVNGGNINITGNSAFDYDVAGQYNGGTVIVNGQQVTNITSAMGGMSGGRGGH